MKSVVICGSRRFAKEIAAFSKKLQSLGVVVYEPRFGFRDTDSWSKLDEDHQQLIFLGLANEHFQKIRKADVVYVFNKDRYSGPSVTLEIGFSHALNKPIYALEKDEEWGRQLLFEEIIKTPAELVKRLK